MSEIMNEARMLSHRTGLRPEACAKWMHHTGVTAVTDLMRRYPDLDHAEAMVRAGEEIEDFILNS